MMASNALLFFFLGRHFVTYLIFSLCDVVKPPEGVIFIIITFNENLVHYFLIY